MSDQTPSIPEQEKQKEDHIKFLQNKLWGCYQSLTEMAEDLLRDKLMSGYPEYSNDRWTVVAAVRMLEHYPLIMDVAKFRISAPSKSTRAPILAGLNEEDFLRSNYNGSLLFAAEKFLSGGIIGVRSEMIIAAFLRENPTVLETAKFRIENGLSSYSPKRS